MLTNTIPSLQQIVKTGDARSAAQASLILRSIADKKPDQIITDAGPEKYYSVYDRYSRENIQSLQGELENITNLPAIDVLIILHILQSLKRPSKIKWTRPITGSVSSPVDTTLPDIDAHARAEGIRLS